MASPTALPDAVRPFTERLLHHGVWLALSMVSVVGFVLSVIGLPMFLTRPPAD